MGLKWRTEFTDSENYWSRSEDGYKNKEKGARCSVDHEWQCPKCGRWNYEVWMNCGEIYPPDKRCGYSRAGCFITTATLTSLGKDDNCYELQLARKFRDTFMKENYPDSVEQYYQIAPQIVDAINNLSEKNIVYKEIWENYLKQFITLIESSKFEETKDLYQKMVEELKFKYLT